MAILQQQIGHKFLAVTPSNTDNIPVGCVGIFVGTSGDISVTGDDNETVLISDVPAGYYEWGPIRINATGTTADGIVAVYA